MKYVASSSSSAAISASITASALLTVFAAFGLAQRGGGEKYYYGISITDSLCSLLGYIPGFGHGRNKPCCICTDFI